MYPVRFDKSRLNVAGTFHKFFRQIILLQRKASAGVEEDYRCSTSGRHGGPLRPRALDQSSQRDALVVARLLVRAQSARGPILG